MQHVTVPQDRIGVVIGAGGETMREIEERAGVRLDIDSESGSVAIEEAGDPVAALVAPDVIKAIGRGFKPETALSILDHDLRTLELIDLTEHTRNDNDLQRKKGRIFFISSKPGLEKGGKALTSYSVSKNMLVKLAEIVNEELQGTEASATVIAPDMIDTSANRQAMPDSDHDQWIKPEEIADAISFYLSEKADRIREPILKMYGSY